VLIQRCLFKTISFFTFNFYIGGIEKVQKRATKFIANNRVVSYVDSLKKLNSPTLIGLYRRLRGDMIETFKIMHGSCNVDSTLHFILSQCFNTLSRGDMLILGGIRRDAFAFLFIRIVFCILL
jgi:hypothetical protein